MKTIKEATESVIAFAGYRKGFFAGDGDFWIACVDHEAATRANCKYIFFVDNKKAMLY